MKRSVATRSDIRVWPRLSILIVLSIQSERYDNMGWPLGIKCISDGFKLDHSVLSILSQRYDRMGWTLGIKFISNGFTCYHPVLLIGWEEHSG